MESEAQQEQQWRDRQRTKARIRLITWIAIAVAGLILCVIAVVLALHSFDRSQYHGDIEYWRDEPEMSPASAAELLHIVDNKHSKTLSSRKMSLPCSRSLRVEQSPFTRGRPPCIGALI